MKLLTHSQLAKVTRNGERSQHDPNFDPHPGREALHPRCAVHLATLGNRPARPRSRLRPLRSRARLPRGRLRQLEGARCRARQVGPSHRARPLVQTEGPALRLRRHRAPLGAHRDVGSSRNRGSNPRSRAGSGPAAVGTQRVAPLKSRWVHCCARRPRRRCRSVGRATLTASKMVPFPALFQRRIPVRVRSRHSFILNPMRDDIALQPRAHIPALQCVHYDDGCSAKSIFRPPATGPVTPGCERVPCVREKAPLRQAAE